MKKCIQNTTRKYKLINCFTGNSWWENLLLACVWTAFHQPTSGTFRDIFVRLQIFATTKRTMTRPAFTGSTGHHFAHVDNIINDIHHTFRVVVDWSGQDDANKATKQKQTGKRIHFSQIQSNLQRNYTISLTKKNSRSGYLQIFNFGLADVRLTIQPSHT